MQAQGRFPSATSIIGGTWKLQSRSAHLARNATWRNAPEVAQPKPTCYSPPESSPDAVMTALFLCLPAAISAHWALPPCWSIKTNMK